MSLCTKVQEHARRLMYQEGATPIPWSVLVVVFTVTFFSGWITTMVFSFLPKLVQWFGVDTVNTGFNVGIIGTSIYIGAFLSSTVWGCLSDKKGRRVCVVATSTCCVVTTLAFGFSMGLEWAVVTRFLQGCSVGQVVVLKGLLREVCDDSNMALGMSVLLTAFSVGNIMGPSVGGYTAFPNLMYPQVFTEDGLFGRFPALLPNLIVATGITLGIFLTMSLLPNDECHRISLGSNTSQNEATHLLHNVDVTEYGTENTAVQNSYVVTYSDTEVAIIDEEKQNKQKKKSRISQLLKHLKDSDLFRVLRTKECLMCSILFFLFAIVDIGFEQMFPILASTDTKYKGMGFDPSQVGTVLMVVSIVQIMFQLTLLPKLSTYLGPQKTLIMSNIVQAILCPVVPALALLHNKTVMWVLLITVVFFIRTCVFTGYLSINILVNNSVDVTVIGSANGVTMTVSYLGKLLAPITCGGIYSWSLRNIKGIPGNAHPLGFPFDQYLAFFFLTLLSGLCAGCTAMLPSRMNHINR